jgi:hypothetical protein
MTMVTFVVRFWRETSAGEVRWRGQIEHVQSREAVTFLDVQAMLGYMQKFGIVTDHVPATGDQVSRLEPSEMKISLLGPDP